MVRILSLFYFVCFMGACSINKVTSQSQKSVATFTQKIPGTTGAFSMKLIPAAKLKLETGREAILDSYYIGINEVTHDLYMFFKRKEFDSNESDLSNDYKADAVTRPTPPYEDMTWGMGNIGGYPAVSMTQQAALRYCHWLYLKTGRFYRLATEAEWTYVAQLISKDEVEQKGWFAENSDTKYRKVGQLKHPSGINDMFGNVLEWTMDSWEDDFLENASGSKNPWVVPTKKHYRVLKGGSFFDNSDDVDAMTRFKSERKWQERDPQIPKSKWWLTDGSFVGFRVVSPVEQPSPEEIEAFFEKAIED